MWVVTPLKLGRSCGAVVAWLGSRPTTKHGTQSPMAETEEQQHPPEETEAKDDMKNGAGWSLGRRPGRKVEFWNKCRGDATVSGRGVGRN